MRAHRFGRVALAGLALGAVLLAGCTGTPETEGTEDPGVETPSREATEDPGEAPPTPAPALDASELDQYGGVARVTFDSSCTGVLLETGVDDAPAYLLTNGHCIGLAFDDANRTIVDAEAFGEARFFDVAGAAEQDVLTVPAAAYAYGTMRGTDIGVVELASTLGELRAAGAVPLPLATAPPEPGTEVVNIAAPVQYLTEREWVLRKSECTLGERTGVLERRWIWLDSIRTDCADVREGSSGSPLIADGEILSLVNTTNTGLAPGLGGTCYMGQPCEITDDGPRFVPESSYAVDLMPLQGCFPSGRFTLGAECALQVAPLWEINDNEGVFGANGVNGMGWPAELALGSADGATVLMSEALAVADAATCADPATYAGAEVLQVPAGSNRETEDGAEPLVVPVTLPEENAFVLYCLAVEGQEANPMRVVVVVDAVPPAQPPAVHVVDGEDGSVLADPLFDLPEIGDIWMLLGDPDATSCADLDAFEPYRRIPVMLEADDLPKRLCVIGYDLAGNASPVGDVMLGG